MGDTEEGTRPEKAYCCSNYPQTEAGLIAKFDLVLQIVGLISAIVSIAAVATDEDPLPPPEGAQGDKIPLIYNSTIATDPSFFFYWSINSQLLVLSPLLVGSVIRIFSSVVLLIGVKKRKHGLLLAWFILTIVFVVVLTILGIITIAYASGKVLFSVLTVTYFLYKWYCLWIVKLLMSEIRAVREGYTNTLEDSAEIEQANNLMPSSDSFTVDKF